jgi:hydrogenase maturation protease
MTILVAGIGNIFLGDDGFGSEVVRSVASSDPRVRVVDYGIRGMHLAYDLLDGCDALVLVDAIPRQGAPGTLHVFEIQQESVGRVGGVDAHAMDPMALFGSLTALGAEPPASITVVGCEIDCIDEGIGLSEPVSAAVPRAVSAVHDVLKILLGDVSMVGG